MATVVSKTAVALAAIEDRLELKVTPASLNMNAALPMGGNQLTGVGALTLVDTANPTAAGSVYYHGGEFYAIDATGTIQLTLNGNLNVGATGTIVGDYGGANPARVTYDDASGEYRFTEETNIWADLVADDVVLKSAAGSVRLGVTNDITTARLFLFKELPTAGVSMLTYDASNSTVNDAQTLRATNDVKVTTLNASGNVTAADHKHTAYQYKRLRNVPHVSAGSITSSTITPIVQVASVGGGGVAELCYTAELKAGDKLREFQIRGNKTSGGNIVIDVYKIAMDGSTILVENAVISIGGISTKTVIVADHTAPANYEDYLIIVSCPAVGDQVRGIGVAWTRQ